MNSVRFSWKRKSRVSNDTDSYRSNSNNANSPANKKAMMKYENLMNKRYKEPEGGKFEDATKEFLKVVSGDPNTD